MSSRPWRDIFSPSSPLSSVALGNSLTELSMDDTAPKLFVSSLDKVRYTVLDVFDPSHNAALDNGQVSDPSSAGKAQTQVQVQVKQHRCAGTNAIDVISHVDPDARARIISIRADASTAPLNITFPLMSQILHQYKIEEEFWEIIRCFGDPPHAAEGGCTHAFARTYPDGSQSCCYDLQYMDENRRFGEHANPWSQRHTGIYHRRIPRSIGGGPFDLILVLHPSMGTAFEAKLHGITKDGLSEREIAQRIYEDPGTIHELLLECYFSNWRRFLRFKGDDFKHRLDDLFTMDANIRNIEDHSLSFSAVQQFRYLRDQILVANSFCQGNSAVIEFLKTIHRNGHTDFTASGAAMQERVRGYLSGLAALAGRIDNAIALLEYSLELKHQELAKESARSMEELTHSTVDDSATVRTITILGLVYLPGSFVSGLFGMNFFDFNNQTDYMDVAKNLWVFVLLYFFFTGVTYGVYLWVERRRKRKAMDRAKSSRVVDRKDTGETTTLSVGRLNMRMKGVSSTWKRDRPGTWRSEKPGLLPTVGSPKLRSAV